MDSIYNTVKFRLLCNDTVTPTFGSQLETEWSEPSIFPPQFTDPFLPSGHIPTLLLQFFESQDNTEEN